MQLIDYMCYQDTTIDFYNSKITNIYGIDSDRGISNGVGKSTIKEAILFALFGKTKLKLQELIRSLPSKAKGCRVVLTLGIDNDIITIIRSYSTLSKLVIKINGAELDFNKIKNKKTYIEDLLGMDYDTCINFSIFDSIRFDDLSSLSSTEIKRLLQLLFNYNKFSTVYGTLKREIQNTTAVINHIKNSKTHYFSTVRVGIIERAITSLTGSYTAASKKLSILGSLKTKLLGEMASHSNMASKNKRTISWITMKSKCPICKQELKNKHNILNQYQSEIKEYTLKNNIILKRITKITKGITTKNMYITALNNKKMKCTNLISKLKSSKKVETDISELQTKLLKCNTSVDILKKFESYVVDHYLYFLETTLNQYLLKLIDISCKISFVKNGSLLTRSFDKFTLRFFRKGVEYSYMALSSGERMLVAYAFKLAINTILFKDTFLFIDEGFNKLDKVNKYKLLGMLKQSPFNQIFLVSHDEPFKELPLLYITKKDDISSITSENEPQK